MRRIGLLMACGLLTSCVAVGTKVSEEQLMQFQRGKTTYAEVVHALGKPTHATLAMDGTRQVHYIYSQSQMRAANYIPIMGAFVRGADSE